MNRARFPASLFWFGSFTVIGAAWCNAAIRYVDASATGLNNGSSWANAYTDLQAALAAAASGDEIWVADGTYRPDQGTGSIWMSFQLKNGVGIYGGFHGDPNGETSLSQRDFAANETVLSGDLLGNDNTPLSNCCAQHPSAGCSDATCQATVCSILDDCCIDPWWDGICVALARAHCESLCSATYREDNSVHVAQAHNVDATAILDGFTVAFGDSLNWNEFGAGLYNTGGAPTIRNCRFYRNRSGQSGGGISVSSSNATISNCLFEGNTGAQGGAVGAFWFAGPTMTLSIEGCTFVANEAAASGGAVWSFGDQILSSTITDSQFVKNAASIGGAVLRSNAGAMNVAGSLFARNRAASGGALAVATNSSTVVDAAVFEHNSATSQGGAIHDADADPIFQDCLFVGNSSPGNGGAVANTLASNPRFINCTLANNTAGAYGGGIYCSTPANAPRLDNCILWGNTHPSPPGTEAQVFGGTATINYSCVQGGWMGAGGHNIQSDPQFIDPQVNFRLRPTSLCSNAGDNDVVPDNYDLSERLRFVANPLAPNTGHCDDDPCFDAGLVDMGPYEVQMDCATGSQDYDENGTLDACEYDHKVGLSIDLDVFFPPGDFTRCTQIVIKRCDGMNSYAAVIDADVTYEPGPPGSPTRGMLTLYNISPLATHVGVKESHTLGRRAVLAFDPVTRKASVFFTHNPDPALDKKLLGGNWTRPNGDQDCIIDSLDFFTMFEEYYLYFACGGSGGNPQTDCCVEPDFNGDGIVDSLDLSWIMFNFLNEDEWGAGDCDDTDICP